MMNRLAPLVLARGKRCIFYAKNARCFSSATDKLIVELDSNSGITTMHANNPPVNGLDSEVLVAAINAVKDAEKNSDVKGIILTSKFDGHVFSAGLNIMDMYQKSYEDLLQYWTKVQDWYLSWYGCSKPTVAVINGHAPAGGCAWALMCDYRIMQAGAGKTIGLNETRLGLVAPFFIAGLMKSTIGKRLSEAALLKGSMFEAEDALKHGLVDEIGALENLIPRAKEQLKQLTAVPTQAYGLTKFLIRQDDINQLNQSRKQDAEMFAGRTCQPEVQKGLGLYIQSLKARKKK